MQGLTGNRLRKGGDRVRDLIQAASGRLACLALAAIMVLETLTGKVRTDRTRIWLPKHEPPGLCYLLSASKLLSTPHNVLVALQSHDM